MKNFKTISLMFPLYKDKSTVEYMIRKSSFVLKKLKRKYEIVIVDDGCPENSGELAKKVAALTGAELNYLPNPRNEAVENDLIVDNRCFIELGLKPTTLDDGLLAEVVDVAKRWSERCDRARIPCISAWTSTQAKAIKKS